MKHVGVKLTGGAISLSLMAILLFTVVMGYPVTGDESSGEDYPVYAGQNILVGEVHIANDGLDDLIIEISITGTGWVMTESHVDVQLDWKDFPMTKKGNPQNGQFEYKYVYDPAVTYHKIIVDISGWDVDYGHTVYVAVHLVVKEIVGGREVQSQTAWGFEHPFPGSNWAQYMSYVLQGEGSEPPEEEWEQETAWVDGDRYVNKGNWATYYTYDGYEAGVEIYAGQTMLAGHATFSAAVGGYVTITIELTNDFIFYGDDENLKVQDYSSAPHGNPAPGSFDWKESLDQGETSATIVVPENNYYGVHLDVAYPVA